MKTFISILTFLLLAITAAAQTSMKKDTTKVQLHGIDYLRVSYIHGYKFFQEHRKLAHLPQNYDEDRLSDIPRINNPELLDSIVKQYMLPVLEEQKLTINNKGVLRIFLVSDLDGNIKDIVFDCVQSLNKIPMNTLYLIEKAIFKSKIKAIFKKEQSALRDANWALSWRFYTCKSLYNE